MFRVRRVNFRQHIADLIEGGNTRPQSHKGDNAVKVKTKVKAGAIATNHNPTIRVGTWQKSR